MSDMYTGISGEQDPNKPKKKTLLGTLGDTLLKGAGSVGKLVSGNPVGAVGLGADVVNTVADLVPNAAERRNNEQVKALQTREKSGELGLGGEQKERLGGKLMAPVQQQQTALTNAYSAAGAKGAGGAAEMGRIRRDAGATLGSAGQAAADTVYQTDKAEEASNKQELEQRLANKSAAGEDARASVTGRIGDFLDVTSQAAGGAPLDIMGPNGTPLKDEGEARRAMDSIPIAKDMQDRVLQMSRQNPNIIAELHRRRQQQAQGGGMANAADAQVTKDWMSNV